MEWPDEGKIALERQRRFARMGEAERIREFLELVDFSFALVEASPYRDRILRADESRRERDQVVFRERLRSKR